MEFNEASNIGTAEHPIPLDPRVNKEVDEFFSSAQASLAVISNLANFYI